MVSCLKILLYVAFLVTPIVLGRRHSVKDCDLIVDTGLCRANIPRWHFNTTSHKCETFTWGGCGGTHNNFKLFSDCEELCINKKQVIMEKQSQMESIPLSSILHNYDNKKWNNSVMLPPVNNPTNINYDKYNIDQHMTYDKNNHQQNINPLNYNQHMQNDQYNPGLKHDQYMQNNQYNPGLKHDQYNQQKHIQNDQYNPGLKHDEYNQQKHIQNVKYNPGLKHDQYNQQKHMQNDQYNHIVQQKYENSEFYNKNATKFEMIPNITKVDEHHHKKDDKHHKKSKHHSRKNSGFSITYNPIIIGITFLNIFLYNSM